MHLLLFLLQEKQFQDIVKINKIVFTEFSLIEDDLNKVLIDIVAFVMVHGPRGKLNPKAKCMTLDLVTNRKKCCKGFPKAFQLKTVI